jgi:hypothetical protein
MTRNLLLRFTRVGIFANPFRKSVNSSFHPRMSRFCTVSGFQGQAILGQTPSLAWTQIPHALVPQQRWEEWHFFPPHRKGLSAATQSTRPPPNSTQIGSSKGQRTVAQVSGASTTGSVSWAMGTARAWSAKSADARREILKERILGRTTVRQR